MAHISLTKKLTLTDDFRQRLRVWVSETTNNIPAQLFVYQRIPSVPLDTDLQDLFVHVASYADLQDYPAETPSEEGPFFRQYFFDLVFDSKAILEENWQRILGSAKHTIEDIVRINEMDPVEIRVVTF